MFQIDLASDLERRIARLSAELDLAGSAELVAVLTAADGKPVIADLSNVTFIDCAGLAALFESKQQIETRGGRFEVRAKGQVRWVFSLTGTEFLLADPVDRDRPYPL
jgi:anti-anti-sigma factor